MSDQKTLDFIQNLSKDLKPNTRLWPIWKRTLFVPLGYLAVVFAVLFSRHSFRASLAHDFSSPGFILEFALLLISIFSLSYFCFSSVVPGSYRKGLKLFVTLPIIVLGSTLTYKFFLTPVRAVPQMAMKSFCEVEILALSMILIPHFYYLLNKGFYVDKKTTYLLLPLSVSIIPIFVMHLFCMTSAKHVLLFHFAPVFALSLLSTYILKKVRP